LPLLSPYGELPDIKLPTYKISSQSLIKETLINLNMKCWKSTDLNTSLTLPRLYCYLNFYIALMFMFPNQKNLSDTCYIHQLYLYKNVMTTPLYSHFPIVQSTVFVLPDTAGLEQFSRAQLWLTGISSHTENAFL